MKNEFEMFVEREGDWFIGYCPEVFGANGQGRTLEESRKNLADAIALVLEDRGQDSDAGQRGDT